MSVVVNHVKFMTATPGDRKRGLLGWVSITLNRSLRLDGLAVRRTLDGRFTLSFPTRRDKTGRRHFVVRPLDDRSRCAIEEQVFRALGLTEETPR